MSMLGTPTVAVGGKGSMNVDRGSEYFALRPKDRESARPTDDERIRGGTASATVGDPPGRFRKLLAHLGRTLIWWHADPRQQEVTRLWRAQFAVPRGDGLCSVRDERVGVGVERYPVPRSLDIRARGPTGTVTEPWVGEGPQDARVVMWLAEGTQEPARRLYDVRFVRSRDRDQVRRIWTLAQCDGDTLVRSRRHAPVVRASSGNVPKPQRSGGDCNDHENRQRTSHEP